MADYPDWVLKHKKKGTYVNCVNGKYYLYAAHSERVRGTKKVRRVSDGYIGRITEEDGLIEAKGRVDGDIYVYRYGLHMTALALADDILLGLRRSRDYRGCEEHILVIGILLATDKTAESGAYYSSYLCKAFPGVDTGKALTKKQQTGVERCTRMVADKLSGVIGGDAGMLEKLANVYMVVINNKQYLSKKPEAVDEWLIANNITWGAPS